VNDPWNGALEQLANRLAILQPGQFLIVECGATHDDAFVPYAQAARDSDGWHCEVVSQHYLPASEWPIDEVVLARLGWRAPGEGDNWNRRAALGDDVAGLLLGALHLGRLCPQEGPFSWVVGTFPRGPDGGLPVDWAERQGQRTAA
jgi:hypothetical protein